MTTNSLKITYSIISVMLLYSLYLLYEFDVLSMVYRADVSKLTVLILAVFSLGFINLGKLVFSRSKVESSDLDFGYEMADLCTALGMLGTVIGFILMTQSFSSFDFSNTESVRDFLKSCAVGMSTKLYTTAVGLIGTMILRLLHFLFGKKLGAI